MIAKIALGLMTLTLFAGMASAPISAVAGEPELTYPTGTLLASGSTLRAASIGEPSFTSTEGNVTCPSAAMTGKLTNNSGSAIEATIESASFNSGGNCSGAHGLSVSTSPSESGIPWCFRSTPEHKADEFQIRGGACDKAERPIRFVVKKTVKTNECTYESEEPILGTYTTDPNTATLNSIGEFEVIEGFCYQSPLLLESSYKFETLGGSPLYIAGGPSLTTLSPGTKVRGSGSVDLTSLVDVNCSSELAGTLKKNSGTVIEIEIEEASISKAATLELCAWPLFVGGNQRYTFNGATNGLPWCLQATSGLGADEFQIRGGGCSSESRPIRFQSDAYPTVECTYERKAPLAGTYATHPKDAALTFENAVFLEVGNHSACPGQTQLDSSMTLERDIAGAQPIFIS